MSPASITACGLAVGLVVIATSALVSRFSAFYRRELSVDAGRRELPLDGLRGIAALMVVMHHAAMFCKGLRLDEWGHTGSLVLLAIGPAGVHLFFMLTGYLFWSKARAAGGKFKIAKLWRGRLYRIAPLYLFCVTLVVAVAIAIGKLRGWNAGMLNPSVRLLGLGLLPWHTFGTFDIGNINAGVVWTLQYEWGFYLVLPFIAWLAVGRRIFWLGIATYAAVFCGLYWFDISMELGLIFILGMLCTVLLEDEPVRAQLRSRIAAGLAVAAMLVLAVLNQAPLLSFSFAFAMFPIFLVAAAGNNFGGLLVRPALRCLGAYSYSLYLLHGIAFYLLMVILKKKNLATLPELTVWAMVVVVSVGVSLFCASTYRWVEFPFLSRSHRKPVPAPKLTPAPSPAEIAG